jgi:hemerythrin superfamily protein
MMQRESAIPIIKGASFVPRSATPSQVELAFGPETPDEPGAIELLVRDHQSLRELFLRFQALRQAPGANPQRAVLVKKLCRDLTIHAEIEEQYFYPRVRAAVGRAALPYLPCVDHAEDRQLIEMIDRLETDHPDFGGAIAFLAAYVLPHMTLEESDLFPLVRQSDVNNVALGRQMKRAQTGLKQNAIRARMASHNFWSKDRFPGAAMQSM